MEKEKFKEKSNEILSNLTWLDTMSRQESADKFYITEKQANAVDEIMSLFREIRWGVLLSDYKKIDYGESKAIEDSVLSGKIGDAVKIRPCAEKYNNKTYFGILIGDVALSISHSIKKDVLTASFSQHNPAIFVPELKEIIYGCQSWWGKISSKEELDELITDDTIDNVWYIKLLKQMEEMEENNKDNEEGQT